VQRLAAVRAGLSGDTERKVAAVPAKAAAEVARQSDVRSAERGSRISVPLSALTRKAGQQLCGFDEFGQLIHTWLQAAAAVMAAGIVMPGYVNVAALFSGSSSGPIAFPTKSVPAYPESAASGKWATCAPRSLAARDCRLMYLRFAPISEVTGNWHVATRTTLIAS